MIHALTRVFAFCLVWFVVATAVLFGCRSVTSENARLEGEAQAARIGKEFTIKVGQQITLDGAGLRIKFLGVEQDSRCPADVNCVWAGNAEVALEVTVGDKCVKKVKLNTHSNSQTAGEEKYEGYRVKLVGLSPHPRSDQKIAPGEYTATLLVSKE